MLDRLRPHILRFLRVPHDPEPPVGAPGSAKVFRAGRNFYHVRLLRWVFTQIGAAVGIAFSVFFIAAMRERFEEIKRPVPPAAAVAAAAATTPVPAAESAPAAAESAPVMAGANPAETPAVAPAQEEPRKKSTRRRGSRKDGEARFNEFVRRHAPDWTMDAVAVLELFAIAGFILQLPVTFAAVRLDWECRWYIVTDRSLRIRAGLVSLQESTMSFANLQQVEVRQGPVQRLLGIADVRVQSAGGGGGEMKGHEQHDSLHTGVFHGVDNAQEIRDLILDRLRHFREAGLGDPEDARLASAPAAESAAASCGQSDGAALAAARELLGEARALRAAAERGPA